jgi:hypothetical protein
MANGKRITKQTPEIIIKRDEGKLEISMRGKGDDEEEMDQISKMKDRNIASRRLN